MRMFQIILYLPITESSDSTCVFSGDPFFFLSAFSGDPYLSYQKSLSLVHPVLFNTKKVCHFVNDVQYQRDSFSPAIVNSKCYF